jgi:hypothetical protein
MLKHLSDKFKLVLLHLCKTTVNSLVIPELWKRVIVKMIPKKNDGKKDPKNYRPISITSCIAQLCEISKKNDQLIIAKDQINKIKDELIEMQKKDLKKNLNSSNFLNIKIYVYLIFSNLF